MDTNNVAIVKPTQEQFRDLITSGGGNYLPTVPAKPADNILIISCLEDKAVAAKLRKSGFKVINHFLLGIGYRTEDASSDPFLKVKL